MAVLALIVHWLTWIVNETQETTLAAAVARRASRQLVRAAASSVVTALDEQQ